MRRRTFAEYATERPPAGLLDVATTLKHFALVTYTIHPDALRPMLPPRLRPLVIDVDGVPRALLSVVIFVNTNFRAAKFPSPSLNMAQINYRAYVIDDDGEHAIWFLRTLLDGWAYVVPRLLWQMPWHRARIQLGWERNAAGLYKSYTVNASDSTASADALHANLVQPARERARPPTVRPSPMRLPGFPDVETGLVCLTHAFKGFFRRRDGKIGVNRVWHPRMPVTPARLVSASFPLLARRGLVSSAEQTKPYSVLLAPRVDFTSRLPPTVVEAGYPSREWEQ